MSLRVISGSAKGRKLKSVPGEGTRPVMDRVKEALFNILAGDLVETSWWDLFGGTGAVGIEALSRGAAFVRFTEFNRVAVDTIRENILRCGFEGRSEIRRGDAFAQLGVAPDRQFEYLYIAPPQYRKMWSEALKRVDERAEWMSTDGTVIVQIDPKEYETLELENFEETRRQKYSRTMLVFYGRRERASA